MREFITMSIEINSCDHYNDWQVVQWTTRAQYTTNPIKQLTCRVFDEHLMGYAELSYFHGCKSKVCTEWKNIRDILLSDKNIKIIRIDENLTKNYPDRWKVGPYFALHLASSTPLHPSVTLHFEMLLFHFLPNWIEYKNVQKKCTLPEVQMKQKRRALRVPFLTTWVDSPGTTLRVIYHLDFWQMLL